MVPHSGNGIALVPATAEGDPPAEGKAIGPAAEGLIGNGQRIGGKPQVSQGVLAVWIRPMLADNYFRSEALEDRWHDAVHAAQSIDIADVGL